MPDAIQTPTPARMTGSIRKLKETGYGFIAGDDGNDYFIHWTAMLPESKDFRTLIIRERVDFEMKDVIIDGQLRKRAIKVKTI